MSIAAGDFRQRLTDLEPTTEVGRLNSAINTMLDRVDGSLAQRDRTVQHMRRFIGDASHELRTPLVSVRGYAELYRMGAIQGEEDTARAMERIEKEAIRMGVLVEDLLALARLDEEREPEIEPLDLRPIARDAALDLRAAAPGRTVTVIDRTVEVTDTATVRIAPIPAPAAAPHTPRGLSRGTLARLRRRPRQPEQLPAIDFTEVADTPVRTPPIVLGEENKVRQVVTNLLGNARRFSPKTDPSRSSSTPTGCAAPGASRSSITARAFPRRSASRSSSASGAPTPPAPGRPAAPDWGSRSSPLS